MKKTFTVTKTVVMLTIMLVMIFLPGCTFYNGMQLRTTDELLHVSTFQFVILGIFVGILVLSVLVTMFGDERQRESAAVIAAAAVLVVLLLCA